MNLNGKPLAIITATYNRAYTLPRLYESLKKQTVKKFRWLIIDDGSNDNTETLVKKWISEGLLDIEYLKKRNGGKHTALNLGIANILEEYTFMLDSDDYIVDDAVESILEWISEIDGKSDLIAVSGLRGYKENNSLSVLGQFPVNKRYVDATNLQRRTKFLMGDKAEIYKTEVLKKYPFSEYENEKFLPEDVVFNKIALEGLKVRWYNKIITISEYLPDGLTASVNQSHFENNIKGYEESYYLNWVGLKFPYNYSSAAEFHMKMKRAGKNAKEEVSALKINCIQYCTICILTKFKKLINSISSRR